MEKLQERIAAAPPAKPQVRTFPALQTTDSVTRESHIRVVTGLRRYYRAYGMDLIVNQALIGKGSIDDLDDEELTALLHTMDQARECIRDGICFEDAGLLRTQFAGQWFAE